MADVVGAALLRRGRVLAARRSREPDGARPGQRWEFPGGKVEPGESRETALVREIEEELGCRITVTGWLPGCVAIGSRHRLHVATATLSGGEPVPREREHDAVRWLGPGELAAVDWLDPDRPFLPGLATLLRGQ